MAKYLIKSYDNITRNHTLEDLETGELIWGVNLFINGDFEEMK